MKKILPLAILATALAASPAYAERGDVRIFGGGNGDNIGVGGVEMTLAEAFGAEMSIGGSGLYNANANNDILFNLKLGMPFGSSLKVIPEVGGSASVAHLENGGYSGINFGVRTEYSGIPWFQFGIGAEYQQPLANKDMESSVVGKIYVNLKK